MKKLLVDDEDLGFCFGDENDNSDEKCEVEGLTTGINFENIFLKEDLEKLSQMCSHLISQGSRKRSDQNENSSNILKLESAGNASILSTPKST